MPRLLHTADWQIGRQFASFDAEHAPILAEARLQAVERIAALASEHAVDAVLVAGDVFDAQTVSDRTLRRLFNALAGFAGPWLLLPGNHDAALAESVWTRAQRLGAVPPNAHLLLSPQVHLFEAQGFALLPAPLVQRHAYTDLTDWFDHAATPPGLARIGIAHGSVQGVLAEGVATTNPLAPDRAARAQLDYLALGDWHGCKRIDARTWYAGTPETDRFRDNDSGQALLVEIDAPGAMPRVTPLPVGQFRWQQCEAELAVPSDADALLHRLAALDARDVFDLRLRGRIDLAGHARLRLAIGQAEAQARHLQADLSGLSLAPTDDDLAQLQADGYLGELIAELREAQGDGTQAPVDAGIAQEALVILASLLAERRPIASAPIQAPASPHAGKPPAQAQPQPEQKQEQEQEPIA